MRIAQIYSNYNYHTFDESKSIKVHVGIPRDFILVYLLDTNNLLNI